MANPDQNPMDVIRVLELLPPDLKLNLDVLRQVMDLQSTRACLKAAFDLAERHGAIDIYLDSDMDDDGDIFLTLRFPKDEDGDTDELTEMDLETTDPADQSMHSDLSEWREGVRNEGVLLSTLNRWISVSDRAAWEMFAGDEDLEKAWRSQERFKQVETTPPGPKPAASRPRYRS